MTANDERPIEIGDRFEDDDKRQGERVVRIITKLDDGRFRYEVQAANRNPRTVGRRHPISEKTLRARYTRVSR